MGLSKECKECIYRRQKERLPKKESSEVKEAYLNEVQRIINMAGEKDTGPVVTEQISRLHQKCFGSLFQFDELKRQYNQMMLEKEDEIREKITTSEDPLRTAVLYARAGNYIDFGAMGSVDENKLEELLERIQEETLSQKDYGELREAIRSAEHIVYLTDNCGEIVLDKLFMEQMKVMNPTCSLSVMVRGIPVLNDATMEDAVQIKIHEIADVYGNGTGIAGTSLEHIDPKIRRKIEESDLIIAKGQGNFETLHHCGLPIFYLFLCKCDWFVNRFGLPRFEGVMIQERNLI